MLGPAAADRRRRGRGGAGPEASGLARAAHHGRGPRRADRGPPRGAVARRAAGIGTGHPAEPCLPAAPPPRAGRIVPRGARAAPTACASTSRAAEPTSPAPARCCAAARGRRRRQRACSMLAEARSLWRGAPLAEFDDVGSAGGVGRHPRCLAARRRRGVRRQRHRRRRHRRGGRGRLRARRRGPAVRGRRVAADASPRRGRSSGRRAAAPVTTIVAASPPRPASSRHRPSRELERAIAGRTTAPVARRLPRPASGLRGRDSELAALQRLLAHERLVTVLGPGGVGKTAPRRRGRGPSRRGPSRCCSRRSPTPPPSLRCSPPRSTCRVVHGDVLAACAALLAAGPQLLLVDNCEHLLPGVRDVVGHAPRRLPAADRAGHEPRTARPRRRAAVPARPAAGDRLPMTSPTSPGHRPSPCSSTAPVASSPASRPVRTTCA